MTYVEQQLLAAVRTAASHPDAATRQRAQQKAEAWASHIGGTLAGTVTTGSRTPVDGLPAWVTLEVLHGGFTSGGAAAGGPLSDDEHDLARDLGLPRTRTALNEWHLTEAGRARLTAMLDDGRYHLRHPENAVLLVVAWLARAGDEPAATDLLHTVGPWFDRLRFYPAAVGQPELPPDQVFRRSEATTRNALAARVPHSKVEAQREAVTVWNPFADELLALWWPVVDAGARGLPPTEDLRAAAERYRALAAEHTRTTRHTSLRTNLGVLVHATLDAASDGFLASCERSRLEHAVRAMVRRRGLPGSPELAGRRAAQRAAVVAPSHAAVAHVVAGRLDPEATGRGVTDPDAVVHPVDAREADDAVPAGATVPASVLRTVTLATQATVEELRDRGIVPSAEVLAELLPQLVAAQHAAGYPDRALGTLQARVYQAFRERRSLLLVDLSAQVRLDELPWVSAAGPYRAVDDATRDAAVAALRRIGGLYLEWFSGTPLPNPLLVELEALAAQAGLDVPLVPELAADIFQGTFSRRFGRAVRFVGEHAGRAYLTYFGLADDVRDLALHGHDATVLAAICRRRAEAAGSGPSRWSVARNGMVVEQAQLMTSHNLAQLAALGVTTDARAAARVAFDDVVRFARAARRPGVEGYLAMGDARAAGLAWRHVVWFVAQLSDDDALAIVDDLARAADGLPDVLAGALGDLRGAILGVRPEHPLLGWSNGPHRLLALGAPRPTL